MGITNSTVYKYGKSDGTFDLDTSFIELEKNLELIPWENRYHHNISLCRQYGKLWDFTKCSNEQRIILKDEIAIINAKYILTKSKLEAIFEEYLKQIPLLNKTKILENKDNIIFYNAVISDIRSFKNGVWVDEYGVDVTTENQKLYDIVHCFRDLSTRNRPLRRKPKQDELKIYALKLNYRNWYIFSSSNFEASVEEIRNTNDFVIEHGIEEPIIKHVHNYDGKISISSIVKKYMIEFGIDNVRGGLYSNSYISPESKQALQEEINYLTSMCFICSINGHSPDRCLHNN